MNNAVSTSAIGEAIQTERGRRMLWLEILVNDRLDLAPWQSEPAVQVAYRTRADGTHGTDAS